MFLVVGVHLQHVCNHVETGQTCGQNEATSCSFWLNVGFHRDFIRIQQTLK